MREIVLQIILQLILAISAWNGDKHKIIAELAATIMRPTALSFLVDRVGDVAEASVWADTEGAETKYPLSYAYHFSYTPYRNCDRFDFKRDCGTNGETKGICLVSGLARSISMAVNPAASREALTDALKFIIHLIADIHQPLHTGFRVDRGGVRVVINNGTSTLHKFWDALPLQESASVDLVTQLMTRLNSNGGRFVEAIRSEFNATNVLSSSANIFEFVSSLASETSTTVTCASAYKNELDDWIYSGETLSEEYMSSRSNHAIVQLLKSAVRLALLADGIHEIFVHNRDVRKMESQAARIAGLFSKEIKVREQTIADINPFNILGIDVDLNECAWDETIQAAPSVSIGAEKSKSKKSTQRRDHKTDEVLLAEATAASRAVSEAMAARKAALMIDGINIDDIVLVKRVGLLLITYKSLAQRKGYRPIKGVYERSFPVLRNPADNAPYTLFFDREVFHDAESSLELIIRVILKIRGVDPLIDISEIKFFWEEAVRSLRGSRHPLADKILARSREWHDGQVMLDERSLVRRINSMEGEIFSFKIDESNYVFVHNSTLAEGGARARNGHMRYIIFQRVDERLLVDPRIFTRCDGKLDGRVMNALLGATISTNRAYFQKLGRLGTKQLMAFARNYKSGIHLDYWFRYTDYFGKEFLDDIKDVIGILDGTVHVPTDRIGFTHEINIAEGMYMVFDWYRVGMIDTYEQVWELMQKGLF